MKGYFITFEGNEGAGKTTLLQSFADLLRGEGYDVVVTREPGGTPLGEKLRTLLLSHHDHPISSRAELLMMLSARMQHIEEVIQPALAEGKIVLCDRYNDSTAAYQGGGRGLGVMEVERLCIEQCRGILPNLTFFLKIDVETGLTRAKGLNKAEARKGEGDRIEGEGRGFHQRVRDAFEHLVKENPERMKVIDGSQSKEAVLEQAFEIFNREYKS